MRSISRPDAWWIWLALACARPACGSAQGWRETQVGGVVVASRPLFAGAGAGLAWRDRGRTRIGLSLAAGAQQGGGVAGRAEAVWHFLLDPGRASGNGVYGGGGLAVAVQADGAARPAILLVFGAENAPAGRRGTFIEVGVGGGARVALGMRWRKRNAPGH